jgi:glutamyl-tRNA reductase
MINFEKAFLLTIFGRIISKTKNLFKNLNYTASNTSEYNNLLREIDAALRRFSAE